jgi:hypothetical protein
MEGRLHSKYLNTLLWSPKSKFKIWVRSDQWLLSYNPFPWRLGVGGWVGGWVAGQVRLYNHTFGHPTGWVSPLGRVWEHLAPLLWYEKVFRFVLHATILSIIKFKVVKKDNMLTVRNLEHF